MMKKDNYDSRIFEPMLVTPEYIVAFYRYKCSDSLLSGYTPVARDLFVLRLLRNVILLDSILARHDT